MYHVVRSYKNSFVGVMVDFGGLVCGRAALISRASIRTVHWFMCELHGLRWRLSEADENEGGAVTRLKLPLA
jgi:hypothetical protein